MCAGKLFEKGLTVGTGQCNVKVWIVRPVLRSASNHILKMYNRYLRDLIISGKAKPSFVVSHHIHLEDARAAYEKFDKRTDGYTKVLLHPGDWEEWKE
jgi:threonine dehydrogenase-like Zn-dependent dehydrogenase